MLFVEILDVHVDVKSLHRILRISRWSGAGAAGCTGLAHAAVVGEIAEQVVHRFERRAVVQVAALALDAYETGVHEFLQVEGQRRARNVEHGGQRARGDALGAGADECPEDPQAGFLGESREGDDGSLFVHGSKFIEIWVPVKGE